MKRALVVTAALAAGIVVAGFYHALYASAVEQIDDPWLSRPGSAGPRLLNAEVVRVELDHPAGLAPHPDAVARLDARIENLTRQRVEVETQVEDLGPGGKATLEEISAIERSHRDTPRVSGSEVGLYLLYLRGEFADSPEVLGIAYGGYSIVVFREMVEGAGTPRPDGECAGVLGPTPCEIERAVLVHEVGHLLGLVNIGYVSAVDHWDEAHGRHCSTASCVMFWKIETRGPFSGPPPDDFDPACREDVALLRAMWTGPEPRYSADPGYVAAMALILAACGGIGGVIAWAMGSKRPRGTGPGRPIPPPPPPPPPPPQGGAG